MFTAIIIGLLAPTLFIKVSGVEKLRIKMPEGVPPAVEKSFNVLIPMLLTLGTFGVLSMVLHTGFQTDVTALINTFIQTPLRALTTNPVGLVVIYSLGVFLFTLGIHQSTINGVLVEPVLTVVLVETTSVYSSGGIDAVIARPDLWLNMNTINVYALMGGSGCTLALLIANVHLGASGAPPARWPSSASCPPSSTSTSRSSTATRSCSTSRSWFRSCSTPSSASSSATSPRSSASSTPPASRCPGPPRSSPRASCPRAATSARASSRSRCWQSSRWSTCPS